MMGYHERCVKCDGDMCDGVDSGETCRPCLKKRIEELEAELAAASGDLDTADKMLEMIREIVRADALDKKV